MAPLLFADLVMRFHMLNGALRGAAALAAAAAFAGEAPVKAFDITIVRGSVPAGQRIVRVEKGDAVRLHVTSDAPGELHLHGYRLEARVTPGMPSDIAFTAYATGRFPFEWHGQHGDSGTRSHHGPPLAALEVHPK